MFSVRRMGFEPFPTLEAALAEAEASLGRECSLIYVPTPPSTIVRANEAGG
ncbi:MAG: hypothetical protein ACE5JJ_08785 [Nitrospinota bacterium]